MMNDAVLDGKNAMEMQLPSAKELPGFQKLIDRAVEFSESDIAGLDAIKKPGQNWVGDEALAIAICCALKFSNDFNKY